MQTDYLRYFIDVATLGSMSSAAKKNFMTPQGVSRSISALENELGCELFQRDSNKVTLTSFGEQLLEDSRALIDRENNMRRTVLELQSAQLRKRRMQFTCYCSPLFFETPLLFPLSGLSFAHYGKVQFLQRSTSEAVSLLLDSARVAQADAIVAAGLGLYDLFDSENERAVRSLIDAGYEYRPLLRTCDYVLVPAYSTLARSDALTNAEIRSHRLAVASTDGMERALARHIGADSVFVSSGDSSYRSHLCRTGEALTFVSGIAFVFGMPEGTVAVPMAEPYSIEIGFAAQRSAFEGGAFADTVERLIEFYGKYEREGVFTLLDGSLSSSMVEV